VGVFNRYYICSSVIIARSMPSRITDAVFSEPSGRRHASVMFATALVFTGLYAYSGLRGDWSSAGWLLPMIAGTALSGVAESLPSNRRRAAGACRAAAILLLTGFLAATVLAPNLVVG
jgi:hypothetical protein